MSILTGPEIRRRVAAGDIEIDPFVEAHVNPASVDLTLGAKVAQYIDSNFEDVDTTFINGRSTRVAIHDVKKSLEVSVKMMGKEGLIFWPRQLYLMHTAERVRTDKFVPVLDGKSSIARIGVQIHLTAGFGDVGYDGEYTLEVVTHRAVRLYPGMRICQIRFHEVVGEIESYQKRGHYVGKASRGPVPSLVHKQFKSKQ